MKAKPFLVGLLCVLCIASVTAATELQFGQTMIGTITLSTEVDEYTFQGAAGDAVEVWATPTNSTVALATTLLDPGGTEIASGTNVNQTASFFRDVRLPSDGTYVLRVKDRTTKTGRYALTLVRTNGANPADEEGGSLIPGRTVYGYITAADLDVYAFSCGVGDVIYLALADAQWQGIEQVLELYGPDGILIRDVSGDTRTSVGPITIGIAGTYRVVVGDSWDGEGAYACTLIKHPYPNAPDPDGGLITPGVAALGTLDYGDFDAYAFPAFAGETFTLQIARRPGSSVTFAPKFELLDPRSISITNSATTILDYSVTRSGMYLVVCAEGSGTHEGDYSLLLDMVPQQSQRVVVGVSHQAAEDVVFWPTTAGTWRLESTPDLQAVPWQQVSAFPTSQGAYSAVTLPGAERRFYRVAGTP